MFLMPHFADFSFVNNLRHGGRFEVVSVSCPLIFLLVCSLNQPPPAHPDTAADILFHKWKIGPARDGKIKKDCHDTHVVFWGKIRGTISLKGFLQSWVQNKESLKRESVTISLCICKCGTLCPKEISTDEEVRKTAELFGPRTVSSRKTERYEKQECGYKKKKTVTESVVVVHFEHILLQGLFASCIS